MLKSMTCPTGATSQSESSWIKDLALIVVGSILIALCFPLSIKLPFTPVSIVLGHHVCLILGIILGKKRGALTVLTYLFQGAIGLPVFALGNAGIAYLLGPKGGYYFGFVAAAYVTGYLFEKMKDKTSYKTFWALAAGNGVIYLFGILQLSFFIGLKSALLLGMVPFLLIDAWKLLLISKGIRRLG